MTTYCKWWNCPNHPATHLIIYGCLNQHLNETPLCGPHHRQWTTKHTQQKIGCALCGERIAEHLTIPHPQ